MRNRFSLLVAAGLALVGFWACKKQENQVTLAGGSTPTLSASVANNGTIPLDYYQRTNNAVTFSWTNPGYQFNTGPSSQGVSYLLEIDTLGANFTNPKKQTATISSDLSKTFTQAELNDLLFVKMGLKDSMMHTIEVRLTSYLGVQAAALASNRMTFKVTPYDIPPKVTPPASGKLFITGSATPLSWMSNGDPEANAVTAGQQFTRVSATKFVINSIKLNADQSFLLVPAYGNWNDKYGYTGGNNANNVNGDDFKYNGGDLKAPAATRNYKVEVDFKLGTYTVTPV